MKIAIKFGDNDFHSTFIGVLETIFEIYKYNEVVPTKAQLVRFINSISDGIHYARQCDYTERLTSKNYLKISESQILLNEEVDDFENPESENWHNGETFILDTDLDFPGNSPTYSV